MTTPMTYTSDMKLIIVETSLFSRIVSNYLKEDKYTALQWFLIENPLGGAVIPGSGSIRKVRWTWLHKGKRGGLRVIYFYK